MDSFPIQTEIIQAIMLGLQTAKKNFSYWTKDPLYLSSAPKNFLSIHVSQSIAQLENTPEIFIDATVHDILSCSLSKKDSARAFMQKNKISQRSISITLDERFEHISDDDSISKVIISLQNGVRNPKDEYLKDIDTMCKMLLRESIDESSLDYAIFGFYMDISNSAKIDAKQRVLQIIESFSNKVNSYKNLKSSFKGGDIIKVENVGEWCVGCYVIEPII